jgi:EARP and GARP complex-interacting protein 1
VSVFVYRIPRPRAVLTKVAVLVMENIIYGLEFNARSLTTQQDAEEIRFFVGTQIINGKNQIHQIEVDEENNKLHSKIFSHDLGEIWKLSSCPNEKLLASV